MSMRVVRLAGAALALYLFAGHAPVLAQAGRLEMVNGAGKQWTKQERDAGADSTRSLKEDEPALVLSTAHSATTISSTRPGRSHAGNRPPAIAIDTAPKGCAARRMP